MSTVEQIVNERKNFGLYRDNEGSSSLHDAIENRHFDLASFLIQRYPNLVQVKDVVSCSIVILRLFIRIRTFQRERTPMDLLNAIDEDGLADEQRDSYEQLKDALQLGGINQDEQ